MTFQTTHFFYFCLQRTTPRSSSRGPSPGASVPPSTAPSQSVMESVAGDSVRPVTEDRSEKGGHGEQTPTDWHWLVLDGPVDTLWVENLNTALDDSKLLCLANGERISLTSGMRLLFEVDNLSQASPATISRCAMVYLVSITCSLLCRHVPLDNRPYAYDVTEGRPRVLGVKRGTAMCAIAKHAASGPAPACQIPGPAQARALTERVRAPMRSASTTRAHSATSLDPQHGVVVMET